MALYKSWTGGRGYHCIEDGIAGGSDHSSWLL
jgi:hypothetical protein